ncbi:COP9 signalosome complex subunit 4 [Chytriomyces hyalinus]|nr:COP9 signalosome complex subunit 4 [Chytriomyces hyalinus]
MDTFQIRCERMTLDFESAQVLLNEALDEAVGLVAARAAVALFVSAFHKRCDTSNSAHVDTALRVWALALERLSTRQVAFEDSISSIRLHLADLLEMNEDWGEAAKVLMGVPLDSGHRQIENVFKLSIYVRIVRLLLEEDDSVAAESYLNRASLLISATDAASLASASQQEQLLTVQFRASQARLFDFKRSFLQAAQKYLSLSYLMLMAESERVVCLVQAVTCAILAPAGPQRSRLLATLYKDDRVRENSELSTVFYPILEKVYLDRILRTSEIDGFRETLKPHQLAKLSDGTTVLDRAVIEHNVLAASKIYTTIRFTELGSLLGVTDAYAAEMVVSRMIGEGRVEGQIDQIEGLVYFYEGRGEDLLAAGIRGVCEQVDVLVDEVMKRNPAWVLSEMKLVREQQDDIVHAVQEYKQQSRTGKHPFSGIMLELCDHQAGQVPATSSTGVQPMSDIVSVLSYGSRVFDAAEIDLAGCTAKCVSVPAFGPVSEVHNKLRDAMNAQQFVRADAQKIVLVIGPQTHCPERFAMDFDLAYISVPQNLTAEQALDFLKSALSYEAHMRGVLIDGFSATVSFAKMFESRIGVPSVVVELSPLTTASNVTVHESEIKLKSHLETDEDIKTFRTYYDDILLTVDASGLDVMYSRFRNALIDADILAPALNVIIAIGNQTSNIDLLCQQLALEFNLQHVQIGDLNDDFSLPKLLHQESSTSTLNLASLQPIDPMMFVPRTKKEVQSGDAHLSQEIQALTNGYAELLNVVQQQRNEAEAREAEFNKEKMALQDQISGLENSLVESQQVAEDELANGTMSVAAEMIHIENDRLREALERARLELEASKAAHASEVDELKIHIDSHKRSAKEATTQRSIEASAETKMELANAWSKCSALETALLEERQALEQAKHELEKMREMSLAHATVEREWVELRSNVESQVSQLQSTLEKEISDRRTRESAYEETISQLQRDLGTATVSVKASSEAQTKSEETILQLTAELKQAKEVAILESTELKSTHDRATQILRSTHENQVSELQSTFDKELSGHRLRESAYEEKISQLQRDLGTATVSVKASSEAQIKAEEIILQLTAELKQAKNLAILESTQLKSTHDGARSTLANQVSQLQSALDKEISDRHAKESAYEEKISQLQSDLGAATMSVKASSEAQTKSEEIILQLTAELKQAKQVAILESTELKSKHDSATQVLRSTLENQVFQLQCTLDKEISGHLSRESAFEEKISQLQRDLGTATVSVKASSEAQIKSEETILQLTAELKQVKDLAILEATNLKSTHYSAMQVVDSQFQLQQSKNEADLREFQERMSASDALAAKLKETIQELTQKLDGYDSEKKREQEALLTENQNMRVVLTSITAEHAAALGAVEAELQNARKRFEELSESHATLTTSHANLQDGIKKFTEEVDAMRQGLEAQISLLSSNIVKVQDERQAAVVSLAEAETKLRIELQKSAERESLITLIKQQMAHLYEKCRRSRVNELEEELMKRDNIITSFKAEVKFLKSLLRSNSNK